VEGCAEGDRIDVRSGPARSGPPENTVVKHLLENGYDVRTVQEYGALKRLYEDHLRVVFSIARHGSSQSGRSNKNSIQPAVTSTVDLNDVFVGIGISMISAENSLRFG
jgi:hypothetical protein